MRGHATKCEYRGARGWDNGQLDRLVWEKVSILNGRFLSKLAWAMAISACPISGMQRTVISVQGKARAFSGWCDAPESCPVRGVEGIRCLLGEKLIPKLIVMNTHLVKLDGTVKHRERRPFMEDQCKTGVDGDHESSK